MVWTRHVACIRENRNIYKFGVQKIKERDKLEDLEVEGKTILRCFKKGELQGPGIDLVGFE
jgi:hypothetical protein